MFTVASQCRFYHPNISRHVAESILLSKQTPDGTFLLRDSSEEWQYTISVRYSTSSDILIVSTCNIQKQDISQALSNDMGW